MGERVVFYTPKLHILYPNFVCVIKDNVDALNRVYRSVAPTRTLFYGSPDKLYLELTNYSIGSDSSK
jgi:hypothetical protein